MRPSFTVDPSSGKVAQRRAKARRGDHLVRFELAREGVARSFD